MAKVATKTAKSTAAKGEAGEHFDGTFDLKTPFEKQIGTSAASLKKIFNADSPPAPNSKQKKLVDYLKGLIKDGRLLNFREYRTWAAIDQSYNIAFSQTTPTLLNSIMARGLGAEDTLNAVKSWGLSESELFDDVERTEADGRVIKEKRLNKTTFYKIFIPLVKAYVTIRTAKLYNDRNQYPLLKFEPVKYTESNRMKCEIVTDLVQQMAHHYGFSMVLRQTILQALLYSICLVFPSEAWHYEEETIDKKDVIVKEGLRYDIPHPSRLFYDINYRLSTFNSDTGCEYAGYWKILKYGDVQRNPNYWNKDKISYGTNWFDPGVSGTFFTEVYPCQSRLYDPLTMNWNASDAPSKERMQALFTSTENEKPVFVTNLFVKLKPKDWGISGYKHKVWFRFVIASDQDILWAEPLPYCPVLYAGYDAHEANPRNPSLALEVLPFQDHIGNIMSQILLSVKQNLAKVVAYDHDQLDEGTIKDLRTQQKSTSGILFFGYSAKQSRIAQQDPSKLFMPITFPQQNVPEMTQTIRTVIEIMERLLGMSSQELGAAGPHIQTAEENRVIAGNNSTRIDYTGSFIDDFMDAWKRQCFYANKAFAEEDYESRVSGFTDESLKTLTDLGFELLGKHNNTAHVKGKWSLLSYEALISTREGLTRINQPAVAQVMMQSLGPVGPILAQNGAIKELIGLYDRAAQMAGVPKDFRFSLPPPPPPQPPDPIRNLKENLNFKDLPPDIKLQFLADLGFKINPQATPEGQAQQLTAQLQQISKQIQAGAVEQVATSLKPVVQEVQTQQHEGAAQQQAIEQLTKAVMLLNEKLNAVGSAAAGAPPLPQASAMDTAR